MSRPTYFLLFVLTLIPGGLKGQLSVTDPAFDLSLSVNGEEWLKEIPGLSFTKVRVESRDYSSVNATLIPFDQRQIFGSDVIGSYQGWETTWGPFNTYFFTSHRVYAQGDVVVFAQEFKNRAQTLNGTSVSHDLDRAVNDVSSVYPSLAPIIPTSGKRGFWTFGGRMSGTPCISIGELKPDTFTIRDGNYGGPLILFDEAGHDVVIITQLNEFMVNQMRHRLNPDPAADATHAGVLDFGLMGSISAVPAPGLKLEYVVVYGSSFGEAFARWGQVLMNYHGKTRAAEEIVSDYLGYWTDNGAFYYYRTMDGLNYEDTLLELNRRFVAMGLPVRNVELDSWFYPKDAIHAVIEWDTIDSDFPNGLQYVQEQTGWSMVAHNRYWSLNNTYDVENGGKYNFIKELFSIPQDDIFWIDFFDNATSWNLKVYNQDWMDFQEVFMKATVRDLEVSRNWLRQMGHGAQLAGVDIQYCMTLARELLQSVESQSVTRIRTSEDYILVADQWRIGVTTHLSDAVGVRSFKDVFWSNRNNPGNVFYYDCMEVDLEADPNNPWPLNYRYTGAVNKTASGYDCIPWAELDLHWYFPLGDLVGDTCRNPAIPEVGTNGRPMCFYEADLSRPMTEWKWENCDLPICEQNCTRFTELVNGSMPYCDEYIEPNPDLQAAVSTLSGGGVGFGDRIENVDVGVIMRTCREDDGRILTTDSPAVAAPVQILEMAFGGVHNPLNPFATDIGEIWSAPVSIGPFKFGLVFAAENKISRSLSMEELGLPALTTEYFVSGFYDFSYLKYLSPGGTTEVSLPLKNEYEFDLYYFSPVWTASNGRKAAFVGDHRKYVPFSGYRFTSIAVSSDELEIHSLGNVPMTVVYSDDGGNSWTRLVMSCPGQGDSTSSDPITVYLDLDSLENYCIDS